jgi:hypothetical protein
MGNYFYDCNLEIQGIMLSRVLHLCNICSVYECLKEREYLHYFNREFLIYRIIG